MQNIFSPIHSELTTAVKGTSDLEGTGCRHCNSKAGGRGQNLRPEGLVGGGHVKAGQGVSLESR